MANHWIDIGILIIIGLSIITGLIRGFLKECIALSVWILAIWLSFNHYAMASSWLQPFIKDPTLLMTVAIILVFVAVLFTGGLFNILVSFFIKRSGLSGMDRLLGMGFGFLRGVFMISLLLVVIQFTSLPSAADIQGSLLYAKFNPLVTWLSSRMPHLIEQVKNMDKQHNFLDLAMDMGDVELIEAKNSPKSGKTLDFR